MSPENDEAALADADAPNSPRFTLNPVMCRTLSEKRASQNSPKQQILRGPSELSLAIIRASRKRMAREKPKAGLVRAISRATATDRL